MRKAYTLLIPLLLTACSYVPVSQSFPSVPESLTQPCQNLKEIPISTTKLSDVLSVVTTNYALYHDCRVEVESWNEWYNTQKKIHDK